jgi:DNA-binding transcriptional ArsR family regulator
MRNPDIREITDSRVLAALAHPLRRRLMDVLKVGGVATASQLAERTDQAVGNISHHLRVLAGCDLIEEVPELARDRRERWWRLVPLELRWSRRDFQDDPAAAAVADAAASLYLERQVDLVRAWFAARDSYSEEWREQGSVSTEAWLSLTPAEARKLTEQLITLMDEWSTREIPEDGQPRESVFVFAHAVPATP